MKVTGKTPENVKRIYIQGSQDSATFHFDDSQGAPKDGLWLHFQAPSDAVDATTSAGARETAVSFSPPPRQVPPQPSNNPRKRKETVPNLGVVDDDDDDDFVQVPPKPPASSSKLPKNAVRKVKKYKSSVAYSKPSEVVENPSKRTNPNYRCAPNKVVETIKCLVEPQILEIMKYPFGPLLDLKLKGLESPKLLVFLMNRLDPDALSLDVGNQKILKITKHAIQCVLGLPNGGEHIAAPDKYKQKEALSNLKKQLGIEPRADVKVQDLVFWIKKGGTDPFTIRCFLLILLGKLLVPGTSDFITGKEAALTEDMSALCSGNLAGVIYDDIVIAAKLWRLKKTRMNPSMHGCLLFLLVFYLDNLMGKHSTTPVDTPRIAYITKQQLLDLIEEDKKVVDGVETFGALPLRRQEGTCYTEGPSSSTYVPVDTQAADVPPASNSVPSSSLPRMYHHLAGCFNRFSAEDQLAAKEALRTCDEEVGILMSRISSAQMTAIQEIRSILREAQARMSPSPPAAQSPVRPTRTATNVEAARQCQPPSSQDGHDPNVLLHEGHNVEAGTDATGVVTFTQVLEGDGFNRLSSSQQGQFLEQIFGTPDTHQSLHNSPHESPYDSPHEVLTNGVCKTCYELDELCRPDKGLTSEEGDADPSAVDQATVEEGNEQLDLYKQVDAAAAGQMASPRTPHISRPMRYFVSDPSGRGIHTESSPLPPPVFDKTPDLYHDWLTPSVDGTEPVTQPWEVSQQLRDAGLQTTAACNKTPDMPPPVFDKTPQQHKHGTENLAHLQECLQLMFDRAESHGSVKKTTTIITKPEVSHPSNKLSMSRNSQHKAVHSRRVFHGRQPPKVSRRNKKLSFKLFSPFKCPHVRGVCPIPLHSALDVRDTIIFDGSLFDVPLVSNVSLGVCSRGEALASSFKDNASTLIEIMNFYTECLRHDEKLLAPHCRGSRLFLSWTLGSLLNCEELLPGQVYDSSTAVKYLSEHLSDVDPTQIKLILWTYHHSNHFSVYCVNRVNTRIDVLDSIDWSKYGGSFEQRNEPWGYRSIKRLSDAFQTVTKNHFEGFSEWPIWSKEVPRQLTGGNSCASFAIRFLRHYDGEESQLRWSIEPSKENHYRAEDLSYVLFHDLNEVRPLPDALEKFRPTITQQ